MLAKFQKGFMLAIMTS